MLYDIITSQIRRQFYITSFEKFKKDNSSECLERFSAKHPLLKPKLIVHNNQPFGFRGVSKRLASLENYPISCEIEYSLLPEDEIQFIEQVDIYSEIQLYKPLQPSKMRQISQLYKKTIQIDWLKPVGSRRAENVIISSTLNDIVFDIYENEIEEESLDIQEMERIVEFYISSFAKCIKMLDELNIHGENLAPLDTIFATN